MPYVGLGPGAHSLRIHDGVQTRSWNPQRPGGWTDAQNRQGCSEILTPKEIEEERIMLGLRTSKGATIGGRIVIIPESDWFIADSIIQNYI